MRPRIPVRLDIDEASHVAVLVTDERHPPSYFHCIPRSEPPRGQRRPDAGSRPKHAGDARRRFVSEALCVPDLPAVSPGSDEANLDEAMSTSYASVVLRAPTPPDVLVDERGRPYFLWDVSMTLEEFLDKIRSGDPEESAYWLARALRDAKPDDVLEWVDWETLARAWPLACRYVGRRRAFWLWWLRKRGYPVDDAE